MRLEKFPGCTNKPLDNCQAGRPPRKSKPWFCPGDLWLEIITNVTGRPVRVLPNSGKAAYGAAVLAAYGVGLIDRGQLVDWLGARQKATVLTPDPAVNAVYERCFANFKRLYDHMRSYFPTVTEG